MGRQPYVPADFLAKLWRAVIEFDMLEDGDRVLIGLSGGKDSMLLTAAMAEMQHYAPIKFELACYTMDAMFSEDFPKAELEAFCEQYGLKHYSEQINVLSLWDDRKIGNTPCYTCAYFRRAAINRKAIELGFNKVAWAHHHDDAVETFALNLFTTGQLKTFLPVTDLTKTGLKLIRPFLYYREQEIIDMVEELGITPLKNPCPYDGNTKRESVKKLIDDLEAFHPGIYEHLSAAMRETPSQELWPAKVKQKALTAKFKAFWAKKNATMQE